jgi:membrane-bound lytic murein transglycosylase B
MSGKSKYSVIAMIMMMMVISSIDISLSSEFTLSGTNKESFFKPVIDKLLLKGVDSNFIMKLISFNGTEFNERFVRINVTGYLNKTDYSNHYSNAAVTKSKKFLEDNIALLQLAENKYGVPKEVITSVLWVETRHGNFLGNSHVASVYLSTAMCSEKQFIEMNLNNLKDNFTGNEDELAKLEEKVIARSEKKSNWAIEQIVALEQIENVSPIHTLDIKGSWAGAFGISQFIPSSYLQWAVDGDSDGTINLFSMPDAIFSVANYLKENGWGDEIDAQKSAVFHYNNSSAYVDAILRLSSLITMDTITFPELEPEPSMKAQAGASDNDL